MKKKSFFYKFDKNRDRFKSSNHSFFAEEEDKAFNKLTALLDKKDVIKELINKTDFEVEGYYKDRINYKKNILENKSYLDGDKNYLLDINEYIFTLKFGKILSYNDIENQSFINIFFFFKKYSEKLLYYNW